MDPSLVREKYNLLYLVAPSMGGIKTHIISLVRGLDKEKFSIHVMGPPNLIRDLKGIEGVKCYEFNIGNMGKVPVLVSNIVRVFRFINNENIQIAHFHGFKASIIGCLACMALKCKTRTIVTVHNFIDNKTAGIFNRLAYNIGIRIIIKNTDICITVSKALARTISSINKLTSGNRIHVVYNGIDTTAFRPVSNTYLYRKNIGYNKEHILIGSVCRLVKGKGLDFLIESIALLKQRGVNAILLIAGDGPYKETLIDYCKDLNVWSNVRFFGYIHNIQDFYNALDIFVLPTLSEGLGISILEAMAAGKPVIATRVGGVPEIVTNRYNGILIRPADSKAIADALMYYMRNPQDKGLHGIRGQDTIENKFTCHNMIKQTQDIYLQVLNERNDT